MAYRPSNYKPTRREALRDVAVAGGVAAAGGLVAPGIFAVPAAAATGDQLIVAVSATPVSLDPEFGASLESWELPVFIYEYLFCYYFKKGADGVGTPQFEPPYEPRLAEKVDVSEDGKKLTFHLRKGVKSEYGNDFTAEDVKWSWDRTFALNTAGMWMMKSSSIPSADSIRIVEPYVLEVSLAGPNSLLMTEQATSLNNPVIYDSTEAKKHAIGRRSLGKGVARQEQRDFRTLPSDAVHPRSASRVRGQPQLLPGEAEDPEGDLARGAVVGDATPAVARRLGSHRQGAGPARAAAVRG